MSKCILVIGVGSIGERHLRCFQSLPDVEVSACEPNSSLREAVSMRYQCRAYASVEEATGCEAFDAVVICTPAHTHLEIAAQCLRAGLHVLIEKPLSTSLEGISEVEKIAANRGLVIRVAYVYRSNTILLKLFETIGALGLSDPKQVIYVGGQNFPSFRPAYRDTYYKDHATGGGAIQDALTHALNTMEWLSGAPIVSLFAEAEHQVLEGVMVEDTVSISSRLANGALASFVINQFQWPNESTFLLHYEAASVIAELHRSRVGVYRKGSSDWEWIDLPAEERDGAFIRQASAFLQAIDGGTTTLSTLEEATQTLRVNLAALESARTQRYVTL